jgi:hypothetical protein
MTEPESTPAPVSSFTPTEIDSEVNSFISDISKEWEEAPPEETPAPVVQAPEAVNKEGENTVEDPTERGLERLVAREVELREREAKLTGAEEEIKALRARLSELEPRALTPELLDKIKLRPADGLRALGLDPDEVVRTALMEKLGDKANTPEMRDMLEKARLRKEMETLRHQVMEAERRQAAQAYYATVESGARDYVKNVEGLSKHAPTVAVVAKTNPDRVHQEIMEEITRDATTRASREPNGDVISYQEAAMRVDKRWSAMKALLVESNPSVAGTAPPAQSPKTTELVAKETPKPPPSTVKPPERPLAPWLQTSKEDDEAIREAVMEWHRINKR